MSKRINSDNQYILICGPTSVGKTTLSSILSKSLKLKIYNEPFKDNPYLSEAYKSDNKYIILSQLFFFCEFSEIHCNIDDDNSSIIQERSIWESLHIFCKMFYDMHIITERDWELSQKIHYLLTKNIIKKPTTIIYLDAKDDTIFQRIKSRGRDFEDFISSEFLMRQRSLYDNWLKTMSTSNIIKVNNDINDPHHIAIKLINKLRI